MRLWTVIIAAAVQASLASAQTPARTSSRQPVVSKPTVRTTSKPTAPTARQGRTRTTTAESKPPRQRPRVVIDAGHGGRDPGGPMKGALVEKDIALQVALRVGDVLRARGVDVIYTRTTDTLIARADRGRIANQARGDVFISIHVNAANPGWRSPGEARGFETYFLGVAKTEDSRRVEAMEEESARFEAKTDDAGSDPLGFILNDMMQNEFLRESADLAEIIQRQLRPIHPGPDRGVKQAGFTVLVSAFMPAVLVELGFGTNAEEARFLATPAKQRDLARAIATATTEYLARHQRRVGTAGVTPSTGTHD